MLGDRLREIRKKFGYTQKEIADFLGVDRSTYTFYETGNTTPAIITLTKLAQFYGMTIDVLVGVKTEKTSSFKLSTAFADEIITDDDNEQKLLELYRNLPEEKKKAVLDMLRALTE